MASFPRQLGIAFGAQSVEGVADATIAGLGISLDLSDGIILGDAGSGLIQSGITHSLERRFRDRGPVTGGFTQQASDFLEEVISIEFAFPLAGPRTTTAGTPVDGDFAHEKGIDALFGACGLSGANSVSNPAVGYKYTPANVSIATAKLWDSGFAWVIRDIRGNLSINAQPGEIAIATATLQGVVASGGAATFPIFNYEEQASISAPSVSGVSPSWGISDEERGWTDLTISFENSIEEIADAASSTGRTIEQTGRTITVDMTIRDTDTDADYTRANLVSTTAPTEDLKATVGTPATGGDAAIAYQFEASNLEVRSYTPAVAGTSAASTISAVCTGTTDGSEFFLAFL